MVAMQWYVTGELVERSSLVTLKSGYSPAADCCGDCRLRLIGRIQEERDIGSRPIWGNMDQWTTVTRNEFSLRTSLRLGHAQDEKNNSITRPLLGINRLSHGIVQYDSREENSIIHEVWGLYSSDWSQAGC